MNILVVKPRVKGWTNQSKFGSTKPMTLGQAWFANGFAFLATFQKALKEETFIKLSFPPVLELKEENHDVEL